MQGRTRSWEAQGRTNSGGTRTNPISRGARTNKLRRHKDEPDLGRRKDERERRTRLGVLFVPLSRLVPLPRRVPGPRLALDRRCHRLQEPQCRIRSIERGTQPLAKDPLADAPLPQPQRQQAAEPRAEHADLPALIGWGGGFFGTEKHSFPARLLLERGIHNHRQRERQRLDREQGPEARVVQLRPQGQRQETAALKGQGANTLATHEKDTVPVKVESTSPRSSIPQHASRGRRPARLSQPAQHSCLLQGPVDLGLDIREPATWPHAKTAWIDPQRRGLGVDHAMDRKGQIDLTLLDDVLGPGAIHAGEGAQPRTGGMRLSQKKVGISQIPAWSREILALRIVQDAYDPRARIQPAEEFPGQMRRSQMGLPEQHEGSLTLPLLKEAGEALGGDSVPQCEIGTPTPRGNVQRADACATALRHHQQLAQNRPAVTPLLLEANPAPELPLADRS